MRFPYWTGPATSPGNGAFAVLPQFGHGHECARCSTKWISGGGGRSADLPLGLDLEGDAFRQPGVAMPADARKMVDDLVGRLDLPQGAALMPRLTAGSAIRLAAHASRALFGNLLDGRFRQTVALWRHAAVAAVLARASQEFLDLLHVGEIERFGLGEFPGHRDNQLDQLALGQTTEIVGMIISWRHVRVLFSICKLYVHRFQKNFDHFGAVAKLMMGQRSRSRVT